MVIIIQTVINLNIEVDSTEYIWTIYDELNKKNNSPMDDIVAVMIIKNELTRLRLKLKKW